jgi:hypothetical protein
MEKMKIRDPGWKKFVSWDLGKTSWILNTVANSILLAEL